MNEKETIVTALSCIGIASTAWLAHKNTCEANNIKTENLKDTWSFYIPTALVGALTIGTVLYGKHQSDKRLATLISSLEIGMRYPDILKKNRKAYWDAEYDVIKVDPPEIKYSNFKNSYYDISIDGDTLFYIPFSGIWFRSSMAAVRSAFYHFNREYIIAGCIGYEELLKYLGIEPDDRDCECGYDEKLQREGFGWIDYHVEEDELPSGEKYYILEFNRNPYILTEND